MTTAADNRAALARHLADLGAGDDVELTEEPTNLPGWTFFRARERGDRSDPTNWAVHDGSVVTDAASGLRRLGDDLGSASSASALTSDEAAIAVVTITRSDGRALTSDRLADQPFWRRWRMRPRLERRADGISVRCIATHTDRGEADEEVNELIPIPPGQSA